MRSTNCSPPILAANEMFDESPSHAHGHGHDDKDVFFDAEDDMGMRAKIFLPIFAVTSALTFGRPP